MAEAKSKKTTKTTASSAKPAAKPTGKKISDVGPKSSASSTSRQIIVNNRQVMHDPMVTAPDFKEDDGLGDLKLDEADQPIVKRQGKKIMPGSQAAVSQPDAKSKAKLASSSTTESDDTGEQLNAAIARLGGYGKPDKSDEPDDAADAEPADQPGEADDVAKADGSTADAEDTAAKDGKTDDEANDQGDAAATKIEVKTKPVSDGKAAEADEPAEQLVKTDTKADEAVPDIVAAASKPAPHPDNDADSDDTADNDQSAADAADDAAVTVPTKPAVTDQDDRLASTIPADDDAESVEAGQTSLSDPTPPVDDDAKEPAKAKKVDHGQLNPEQAEAVASGKYFLPIETADTRRLRRELILSAIIIIVLLAIWVDVVLDAGLLKVDGLSPLTNFF